MGKRKAKKQQGSPAAPPTGGNPVVFSGGMSKIEQAVRSKIAELELSAAAPPALGAGTSGAAATGAQGGLEADPEWLKEGTGGAGVLNATSPAMTALAELEATPSPVFTKEDDDSHIHILLQLFDKEIADESRSIEERIQVVRDLYAEQERCRLGMERKLGALDSRCTVLQPGTEKARAELEGARADLGRMGAQTQRLRNLCRELQTNNKKIVGERNRVAGEEQERRCELSAHFNSVIQDIAASIEDQDMERKRQLDENKELRAKLQAYISEHEARETAYVEQLAAVEIESRQLEELYAAQNALAAQEKAKAAGYQDHIRVLSEKESELRCQLSTYADKFEQFQDALNRSNDMFSEFKNKMEAMTKTIKQLERDNASLRNKSEKSTIAMKEMEEEAQRNCSELKLLRTQKERLEGLCRTMQGERAVRQQNISNLRDKVYTLKHGVPPPGSENDKQEGKNGSDNVNAYYEDFAKMIL
eukprot:CAMPEP_0117759810 /NCGR_PEP_ID=MMETSP0947-20121206/16229_1 /TAXON_ID=44440 /ORGANISM="Chattonella subsalsa, Strain CCMP2191" /LENGTH=475 /DNA_ID=CAMNT_0005580327 /DNA_START=1 /DNA_END=1428 /DNA_ORIENTATION=-